MFGRAIGVCTIRKEYGALTLAIRYELGNLKMMTIRIDGSTFEKYVAAAPAATGFSLLGPHMGDL